MSSLINLLINNGRIQISKNKTSESEGKCWINNMGGSLNNILFKFDNNCPNFLWVNCDSQHTRFPKLSILLYNQISQLHCSDNKIEIFSTIIISLADNVIGIEWCYHMIIGSQRQSQVILFIFKADHYTDFFFHYQDWCSFKGDQQKFQKRKKYDLTVRLCAE